MRKTLTTACVFLTAIFGLFGQYTPDGKPVSGLYPRLAAAAIPDVVMPAVDVAALLLEDAQVPASAEKPRRFGKVLDASVVPSADGRTDLLPGGDRLSRVGIVAEGARSINLIFSNFRLPAGAQLFVYTPDRKLVLGPFTADQNNPDDVLATSPLPGDRIIVEYYEPTWAEFRSSPVVSKVVHGYRQIGDNGHIETRDFGDSDACQININCPEGNAFDNVKRSVCRVINGGDWCTAFLVNNTNSDGTPYVMTANHCYEGTFPTWVFWFNWEADNCSNPSSSPSYQSVSGASIKARNAASDFMLMRLNEAPPAEFNVFYAGWDHSGNTPGSAACIHHPSGDIKKISLSNQSLGSDNWIGTPANSHWVATWSSGVTEPGSSGAPLFNAENRVVGQLHGGPSQCGGSNLSDMFGKFSMSWSNTGQASSRLKDWLDPSNTGATAIDGFDPVTGPYLSVSPAHYNVSASAGQIEVTPNTNQNWTVSANQSWVSLSVSIGAPGDQLLISYEPNSASISRSATVTFSGGGLNRTLSIIQQGFEVVVCENGGEPANNERSNQAPTVGLNSDIHSMIPTAGDNDWWRFSLGSPAEVSILLDELPADFDIRLYNQGGDLLANSENAGTEPEKIIRKLNTGTYYARVEPFGGAKSDLCYRLRIETSPSDGTFTADKIAEELPFDMQPNPADDEVFVSLSAKGEAEVLLYDTTGRLVLRQKGYQQITVPAATLPAGVYALKVVVGDRSNTKKLVVY